MERVATLSAQPMALVDDLMVGRRAHQRHRIDLSARLVTGAVNTRVQLEDISAGGACIRLKHPQPIGDGRLSWLGFAAFARVLWRSDLRCGLLFEEPLDADCLAQTIRYAELLDSDPGDRFLKLASAWTHGPGDW